MPTTPTEAASHTKLALLVMAGFSTPAIVLTNPSKIFTWNDKNSVCKNFQVARARIAKNTGNPRLIQIRFHTLHHWKATREFQKTNNVILVM